MSAAGRQPTSAKALAAGKKKQLGLQRWDRHMRQLPLYDREGMALNCGRLLGFDHSRRERQLATVSIVPDHHGLAVPNLTLQEQSSQGALDLLLNRAFQRASAV